VDAELLQHKQKHSVDSDRFTHLVRLEEPTPQEQLEMQFLAGQLQGLQQEMVALQQMKSQLLQNAGEFLASLFGRGGWHSS
jgi:hypothetical protein